jgi:putative membrane protein
MHIVLHVALLTATVLLLARFLPGVRIKSTGTAAIVAVVFSLLNWAVGWLIAGALVLPALLTLGLLFLFIPFIVNTVVLWLTDKLLDAFEIRDLQALLLSSGAITVANGVFHMLFRHHRF